MSFGSFALGVLHWEFCNEEFCSLCATYDIIELRMAFYKKTNNIEIGVDEDGKSVAVGDGGDNEIKKVRVRAPMSDEYLELNALMSLWGLNTVCREALCPNIGECWSQKHAAFMILGDTCTRMCTFCNVKKGRPKEVDLEEPYRIAMAVKHLALQYVVITSVDRDDLADGGASHFAETIRHIREQAPNTTIEILTPDFLRKPTAFEIILKSRPDVFNHNLETVPDLYRAVRPIAKYSTSLELLKNIKLADADIFTKSGIMVGLGETSKQVLSTMDDMRVHLVDFITIGQYLQPSENHYPVKEYVDEEKFKFYEEEAWKKGFLMVSCSALTRSSYHAGELFKQLKVRREQGK